MRSRRVAGVTGTLDAIDAPLRGSMARRASAFTTIPVRQGYRRAECAPLEAGVPQRAAARRLPWCWSRGSVGYGRCEGARGKKARQETLKRVLKNAKTFVRDLSSEVLRAKELWSEEDFAADAELVYAAHTLHRLNELKVVAEAEQREGIARRSGSLSARRPLPGRLVPRLPPQVHGPAGDALPDVRRALHVQRASSRWETSAPRTFRSRRANRARRWPIDWRSARRWRAARVRPDS